MNGEPQAESLAINSLNSAVMDTTASNASYEPSFFGVSFRRADVCVPVMTPVSTSNSHAK